MRFSIPIELFISLFFCLSVSAFAQTDPTSSTFIHPRDTLRQQLEDEKRRTLDPQLGTVPYERLAAAREKILKDRKLGVSNQSGIPGVTWQERGPNNAAGRTRTVYFDPSDAAHKRVWAGTLAGGLWQTNDITDANAGWTPQSDTWENTVVTCIAADPSNPSIVYVGTGDMYSSKSGGGIWKTTNGGASWTRLSSTVPINTGNYPSLGRAFTYIQRMVVNSSGQVFAATPYGVVRSVDGGVIWQFVLAPNMGIGFGTSNGQYYNDRVNDLELASDGILYASFNPGRVFKSTNAAGTSWAEITPATGGERTELAVSPATNGAGQVVYAVSRAYNNVNYSQDIKWFKKSTNGGASWTDVTMPIPYSDAHFTAGNGNYNMDITAHPTDSNTVYAGGYALFRSVDGGVSWTKLTETATNNSLYNQTGLQCAPGGVGFVNTSDQGVFWSADGANAAVAVPTVVSRNNGFRSGEAYTVAMKGSPGSNYFMANVQPPGIIIMNAPNGGVGVSNGTIWGTSSTNIPYIDADESNIQIFSGYNSVNVYNGVSYQQIFTINNSPFTADYDSQANTLYTYDYVNSQHIIRRTTGIGTSPVNTTLVLTGVTDQPSYLKLGTDRMALFAGNAVGALYKLTNLGQSTPTIVRIDNGVFGQGTVSCIDVGATDNELLVTLSNYGVQSVWYTADGGDTWTGKDQTNYGLPDVPVRTALFNPQNRQQVLLGTDLGVWSTTNILASNPGWAISGSMPLNQVNQLRYRASDGRIAAATVGRGIWTTDAFAVLYTLPTITLTGVSTTSLCAGSVASVSFNISGTFNATSQFEVYVSDASGSFATQRRVGVGASSPVSFTLPGGSGTLPYGTNYQVKVVSTNPEVESGPSGSLAIGNLDNAFVADRTGNSYSGQICTGSQATIAFRPKTYNGGDSPADGYQWTRNGIAINGATSASYIAVQTGVYSGTVYQAGCAKIVSTYSLNLGSSMGVGLQRSSYDYNQCAGRSVSVYGQYAGDNALYQWLKDGQVISGATSASYTVTQTGRYDLSIRDQSCNVSIGPASYQFGASIEASVYFNNVADSLVCAGYPTGAYMYLNSESKFDFYQWYRNGVAIPGTTNSYYYYGSTPGNYSVMGRQGNCQTASNTITRTAVQEIPVAITVYGNTNLCIGESRTLYAQSVNNSSYRWQLNGIDIPGATSSQYTVLSSGIYTLRDTVGRVCTSVSAPISFTFSNAIQPKIVIESAGPNESCYGIYVYNLDSYYGANQLSGYTYQWQRDGGDLPGAVSTSVYAGTTGVYTIRVTNGSCTGVSKGVFMKIGALPKPTITVNYRTLERCANNVVNLYNFTPGSNYQWKRNGTAIPDTYLNNLYAITSGRYSVVTSNGGCTAESDPVDVKIGEPTAATITGSALVNVGQTTYLPILFSGPAPWSLTLSNGQSATAITQNPYLMPVSPSATTTYAIASVVNACGTGTTTGNAVVTVGTGSADVSLNMAVSTRTPKVGDVVSYTINATNTGPQDAVGAQVQGMLPAGVAFLDAPSGGITSVGNVVFMSASTIPAGTTVPYVFRATVTAPGTFVASAQVIASQTPDPDSQPGSGTGDGQDDVAFSDLRTADQNGPLVTPDNPNQVPLPKLRSNQPAPVSSAVELSLQLDLDKLVINVAQQDVLTATLTVRNRGGIPATGVVVRVLLPNGVPFPASQTGWQSIDSQTLSGYLNTIPAGGAASVKLLWRPTGEGSLKAQIFDVIETPYASTPGNGYVLGEKDEVQSRIRVR